MTQSGIVFNSLESETLYYIRVRATSTTDNYSTSDWSHLLSCTTLKSPTPPTDILLSNNIIKYDNAEPGELVGSLDVIDPNEGDSVTFSLPDNTGDNDLFAIDGNYLVIGQSKPDTGNYTIVIRATDLTGLTFDKTFSLDIAPSQLRPPWPWADCTATTIILGWNDSGIPCTYEVQISQDDENWSEPVPCHVKWHEISGLDHDTTLHMRVRCITINDNHTNSEWSNTVTETTLGPPPKPNATAISQSCILITWYDHYGPKTIERAVCDTNEWTQLATDYYETSFVDSTALPDRRYLYRLVSGDSYSEPDIAWLSTIVHYSFIAECHEGTVDKVKWQVVTELTV